jgi:hypothetical protein
MKRTQTPLACDRCGSVYFQEAEFGQYRGGLYSSAPGGEISHLTDLPQRARICICGEPMPDTSIRPTGEDARSFAQSVAAAKAHRARQQPDALLQELLAELAAKKHLAEAQQRLAAIELALQAITAEAIESSKQ